MTSFVLMLFLIICDNKPRHLLNEVSVYLLDNVTEAYVGREVSMPELLVNTSKKSSTQTPFAGQLDVICLRVINLTRKLVIVNVLLMCNDISLNPGPANVCSSCIKAVKSNQPRTFCKHCNLIFHLKCVGLQFESTQSCYLCSTSTDPITVCDNMTVRFLPKSLKNITWVQGLKVIHQNIRGLVGKIDELRLIIAEFKAEIHILTLSETWTHEGITNAELDIPGYYLHRQDRDSKGGSVAVYVKKEISVVHRSDLEAPSIESLWLEILVIKSRSFLIGTFFIPPTSSAYYNREFVSKLEDTLEIATAQGREVIIMGDFNSDFLAKRNLSAGL